MGVYARRVNSSLYQLGSGRAIWCLSSKVIESSLSYGRITKNFFQITQKDKLCTYIDRNGLWHSEDCSTSLPGLCKATTKGKLTDGFFSSGTLIDIRLIEQSRSLWRSHFWSWWLQRLSKWLVQQCWWCHWPLLYKSFLRARNSELGRNRMQKSARWFTCQHSWPREKSTCRSRRVLRVSKKYFTFH